MLEYLSWLPKSLIDAVIGLLKIKNDDRTRQRMADLLVDVGDCVEAIGANVRDGKHSEERCGELKAYIAHLQNVIATETDERTARQLTLWLDHVGEVPGAAKIDIQSTVLAEVKPRWTQATRYEQADRVLAIAGAIRGVGNLLRV